MKSPRNLLNRGLLGLFAVAVVPSVVLHSEIRGTIDPATSQFLKQSVKKAEAANAEVLIIELDTPGGLLSSAKEMAQTIGQSKVPVVVYVSPPGASATSAGAILTLASHRAAMAPGTNIGAAHPVEADGKDVPGAMGEKVTNDTAAFAKSLAETRGRSLETAEAMVRKSLSLTAPEALKSKIVESLADNIPDLLRQLDGKEIKLTSGEVKKPQTSNATVQKEQMSLGLRILHFLAHPNVATILMTVAMLCIYVEISNPGVVIPGVVGAIALLLAFTAFQMLPIRTTGFLLIALAMILMIGEAFANTHGVLGAGGVISFILGILWVIDPNETTLRISPQVWVPAAAAMGGGTLAIGYFATRSHRLAVAAREKMGGFSASGLSGYRGQVESISADGLSGKASFRGEIWDVFSSEPLQIGASVEVAKVDGMKAFVKRVH